jgi:hypothetical protein
MSDLTPRENLIVQKAVETILRMLPAVLGRLMEHGAYMQKQLEDFYASNSDLKHNKSFALVVQDVENNHPDWSTSEILTEATRQYRSAPKPTTLATNGKPSLADLDQRGRDNGIF